MGILFVSLAEELRAELDANRALAEKLKQELDTEKRCAEELKEAMQMAMEGHARMLEQYADLEERHIHLLARHRRIREGIDDVKKAASKAGVRGAESKFINALAAEISALKAEREKEEAHFDFDLFVIGAGGRRGGGHVQQTQQPVPLMQQQMLPRGRVYRYPPGRKMPGIAGGMLSVPYDMGAMPVRDAIEGMNGQDLDTRNIQNNPVVNRDPMSSEMLKMRQQLEYLQAEFFARGGCSSNEVQVLKERIAWLEAANEDLCRELHDYRSRYTAVEQRETDDQDASICSVKTDGLKRSLHSVESPDYQMGETISGDSRDIDEEVAKEWEHTLLQNIMEENVRLSALLDKKEAQLLAMNEQCKGAAAWGKEREENELGQVFNRAARNSAARHSGMPETVLLPETVLTE